MLIAESGSTKTNWALVENGRLTDTFSTDGCNPVTQRKEQIIETIQNQLMPKMQNQKPGYIAFYGAGISNAERAQTIENSLKEFFPQAKMEIEHDLLAAARAAYEGKTTIVAIMGTGSNSCVYNGKDIVTQVPSMGFIIGDEGSGAHMGKSLVRDYAYDKMPKKIKRLFDEKYGMSKDDIIDRVYKMPDPNRWLASLSHFISDNIKDEYCRSLVLSSIRAFFETQISSYAQYKNAPFNSIGSIALHFQEHLQQVCNEFGFKFGRVIQSPLTELVRYHLERKKN